MGSFCPNHIKFQLQNYRRFITHDMEEWCKWLEVANMTWGIWWNFPQPLKSLKICFRWALCFKSVQGLSYKNTEDLTFMTLNKWCKIWINLDLQKMAWGTRWTFIRALKSLKNCTFMGSFCPKHIMIQQENFIGIMCHYTEGGCKT